MASPLVKDIIFTIQAISFIILVGIIYIIYSNVGPECQMPIFKIMGLSIILILITGLKNWLYVPPKLSKSEKYNIPTTGFSHRLIEQAISSIKNSKPEDAIDRLKDLRTPNLDLVIANFMSRLAKYRQDVIKGVLSNDEKNIDLNKINNEILELIKTLKIELKAGSNNFNSIKIYLRDRYIAALKRKIAGRPPINIRCISSTKGTSTEKSKSFETLNFKPDKESLFQTFKQSKGRLLLIGEPGSGKQVKLLQLAIEILSTETGVLPVILNLSTWHKYSYTLDLGEWLKRVLPIELNIPTHYMKEITLNEQLILLFDGFDEIPESDRVTFLESIAIYGEDRQVKFVISSRTQEYINVPNDAPVYGQIEIGQIDLAQMEAELLRLYENENDVEHGSKNFYLAILEDPILHEIAKVPFYFNILQVLFSRGIALKNLKSNNPDIEGRSKEIVGLYINQCLSLSKNKTWQVKDMQKWLRFLAFQMTKEHKQVFELTDLQYTWHKWSRYQIWIIGLTSGFIIAAMNWTIIGIMIGLFLSLVASKSLGIFSVLYNSLIAGLYGGALLGISNGVKYGVSRKLPFVKAKSGYNWSWKKNSNLSNIDKVYLIAIWVSSIGAGYYYNHLIPFFILGIALSLIKIIKKSTDIIQTTSPYQHFFASIKEFKFSIFEHFVLRFQFYIADILPLYLVIFLNEMSLLYILEFDGDPKTGKGGGSWHFRHRILQEWFAEKWVEPEGPEKKT